MIVPLHVKASKCEPSLPEEISHVIRKAGTVEKDLLQSAPPRIRTLIHRRNPNEVSPPVI